MKSGLYYINACPSSPLHEPDPLKAPEGPVMLMYEDGMAFVSIEPAKVDDYEVAGLRQVAELLHGHGITPDDLRELVSNVELAAKLVYKEVEKTCLSLMTTKQTGGD